MLLDALLDKSKEVVRTQSNGNELPVGRVALTNY